MANSMDYREIKQKIAEGYIYIRAIVEIVGKPKVYVKKALESHLKKIKEDDSFIITKEKIEPPEPQENFFSTFAELELLIKNPKILSSFCFDYMPSSIEILEPQNLNFSSNDLTDFLNDLQARSHALNTMVIQLRDNAKFYVKNTAVLLRNFIVVLLSARALTIDQMHPYLGVKKEDIAKILKILIKEGKVKKDGDKYRAVPNERLQKSN